MGKVTFADKIGVVPKQTRENQVWDDDINEMKTAINDNHKTYQGFYCNTYDPARTDFIVGDKFSGWVGDRFIAGKILQIPVDVATEYDDTNKVALAVNGEI